MSGRKKKARNAAQMFLRERTATAAEKAEEDRRFRDATREAPTDYERRRGVATTVCACGWVVPHRSTIRVVAPDLRKSEECAVTMDCPICARPHRFVLKELTLDQLAKRAGRPLLGQG